MSSMARRLQKRLLTKSGVSQVPVNTAAGKTVGFRHRLCAAHIGYLVDGTPLRAPAPKPKRTRKPKADSAEAAPAATAPKARKPRAKKAA